MAAPSSAANHQSIDFKGSPAYQIDMKVNRAAFLCYMVWSKIQYERLCDASVLVVISQDVEESFVLLSAL